MRRSWLIFIATGTLAFGGALATAVPAAAAPAAVTWLAGPLTGPPGPQGSPVQPGGLIQRTTANVKSGPAKTVALSTNWAGYAATGATGAFSSVSSSWVQPAGNCAFNNRYSDQYSAYWVGLDGYASNTVEQTGSEVDCAGRTAEYGAWYEFYPANPVYFNKPIKAGDHFTGSVTYSTITSEFTVTLTDTTEDWTQTASQAVTGAKRSSAEVITEAPCCTVSGYPLPLTNFGTASFTGATVNTAGLCQSHPVEIIMPEVGVSPISACENFSVAYLGGIWNF